MREYVQGFHRYWHSLHAASNDKCWLGLGDCVHDLLLFDLNSWNFTFGSMPPTAQRLLSGLGEESIWKLWLFPDCRAGGLFPILLLRVLLHLCQHDHSKSLSESWDSTTKYADHHVADGSYYDTLGLDPAHWQNEGGEFDGRCHHHHGHFRCRWERVKRIGCHWLMTPSNHQPENI